jgi:hypothetical protein
MKKLIILSLMSLLISVLPIRVLATSTATGQALGYLKSQQASSGAISGFGGESQWAVLGFVANGVDVAAVKNPNVSLQSYVLSDHPGVGAAATEWERRILALRALKQDVTNVGGVNYLAGLEALYSANQLGSPGLLNDDIFGVLALISAGGANAVIVQDSLNYLIAHQNTDGGFGYATSGAGSFSDGNDTAAAIQALVAARVAGFSHPQLEGAIASAQTYLLSTQAPSGGFGYDAFSEADGSSTAWALMALNVLGQSDSAAATSAKNWLLSNQQADGGFGYVAYGTVGSDTYTTSHALVALSGNGWLVKQPVSIQPIEVAPNPVGGSGAGTASAPARAGDSFEPLVEGATTASVLAQTNPLAAAAETAAANQAPPVAVKAATASASSGVRWGLLALSVCSLLGACYYGIGLLRGRAR